ncbi:MAG TPA: GDSL-type esterase/lipase family protein, partial [Kofleriaceae bacterium]
MLRGTLRWLAALSLALNAVLVGLWAVRHLLPQPVPWLRERARGDLFHALATGTVTRRDVVVVGDSLTECGEWWELLDRPVANRGVAGDTVAAVRARLDDIVAMDPRVVVVGIGVNDLLAGASPEALAA